MHAAPAAATASARALLVALLLVVAFMAAAILAGPVGRSTVEPGAAPAPGVGAGWIHAAT